MRRLIIVPIIVLAAISQLGAQGQNSRTYFPKSVVFPPSATLEQKIEMASRVVPSVQQRSWQELEMTAFLHFTVNTFTDLEWGHGTESPQIFNPAELDADQWVRTLKEAGFKMAILTAKHHDGFCLWPTKTTSHSVASSPWRSGKGDVVKMLRDACTKYGMKFGIYLSPWDRNAKSYGDSPAYDKMFMEQLTELLTNYGRVDEVWFDGANGEGPNGKKQVYNWDAYYDLIKKLQPNAVVAVSGEDVRWVGNEHGEGRITEWSVTPYAPGARPEMVEINRRLGIDAMSKDLGSKELLERADRVFWYPSEVDVSIRPGWFYHKSEDSRVKTLSQLANIYFTSVGRNSVLLLNIPPDTRGLINEADAARLKEFGAFLRQTFSVDLMAQAKSAEGKYAIDKSKETDWSPGKLPAVAEFTFTKPVTANVFQIQENIGKGQRVEQFKAEVFDGKQWILVGDETTIGYKRLLQFPTMKVSKLRVTINKARALPNIGNIGLFRSPEILSLPVISRNKKGQVSIDAESATATIRYTTDGSLPTASSPIYRTPFDMANGGEVKARTFIDGGRRSSDIVSENFDICSDKWRVVAADSADSSFPAINAIDGKVSTMWHTPWNGKIKNHPYFIAVDMGEMLNLKGFTYSPRTDGNRSGTITKFEFYTSVDGVNWKKADCNSEFANITNNTVKQYIHFNQPLEARYFKLVSLDDVLHQGWVSVGEIGVITR